MKQLEVQIMGQGYLLGCPEGGDARLLAAVQKVDAAMCKIRDAGKIKARDRIAVLAALNLAFEVHESAPELAVPNQAVAATAAAASSTTDLPDPRLGVLLARLDQVLGADGQLL